MMCAGVVVRVSELVTKRSPLRFRVVPISYSESGQAAVHQAVWLVLVKGRWCYEGVAVPVQSSGSLPPNLWRSSTRADWRTDTQTHSHLHQSGCDAFIEYETICCRLFITALPITVELMNNIAIQLILRISSNKPSPVMARHYCDCDGVMMSLRHCSSDDDLF